MSALGLSAAWHDLGKLDPKNQTVLRSKPQERLAVQHEYAGVRHLREQGQGTAATLVYAHHRGLPNLSEVLFESIPLDENWEESTLGRCDELLSDMLRNHCEAAPEASDVLSRPQEWRADAMRRSGLFWRMALSCLVGADHSDTARHYGGETDSAAYEGRWAERLASLDRYVAELAKKGDVAPERKQLRQAVYGGCRKLQAADAMYGCDSGVGTGKTTAVMAHLLRVAQQRGLRHIFVVLPYTNIINQSVETYRAALTLEGEDEERAVAAHHHQVDFEFGRTAPTGDPVGLPDHGDDGRSILRNLSGMSGDAAAKAARAGGSGRFH